MIRKHFVGRIAELNKQVGRYYLIGVVGLSLSSCMYVHVVCIQCRYKTQIVNLPITMQRYVVYNIECKGFM